MELAWLVHLVEQRYGVGSTSTTTNSAGMRTVDDAVEVFRGVADRRAQMAERTPVARLTGRVRGERASGRGAEAQLAGVLAGAPAFADRSSRFDTAAGRVTVARRTLPSVGTLADELAARSTRPARRPAWTAAARGDAAAARPARRPGWLARCASRTSPRAGCGLAAHRPRLHQRLRRRRARRVADAAAVIRAGRRRPRRGRRRLPRRPRPVRALRRRPGARRRRARSARSARGRRGLLLGDGVAAVVLESAGVAAARGAEPLARIAGWGARRRRLPLCQPQPGRHRAGPRDRRRRCAGPGCPRATVGYVNANGTGTTHSDAAEAAALRRAFGDALATRSRSAPPSPCTGTRWRPSGLLELVVTVLALRHGRLPVNAGFLAPDDACPPRPRRRPPAGPPRRTR